MNIEDHKVKKLKTYIDGFDEKLNGGIPEGCIVLIVGEPGTFKSTLVYYIMYHNAIFNHYSSVYITIEQNRESIIQNMNTIGLPQDRVQDKISIIDLGTLRKTLTNEIKSESWFQIFRMYIDNLKNSMDYQILGIDSLQVLEILSKIESPREELYSFFEWLRELKITTFIISEQNPVTKEYAKYGEDFMADGIIHLRMDVLSEVSVQRRIRCVKMRNTAHSPNYYSLLLQGNKFQVTEVLLE